MINTDEKFIIYQVRNKRAKGWTDCGPEWFDECRRNASMVTRRLAIMPDHFITARGYYGSSGWQYHAVLCSALSGNVVLKVEGFGDWVDAMCEAMAREGLYPERDGMNPTRYFREVCNVPYDFREVSKKKEL
jgi:hypothetical protein